MRSQKDLSRSNGVSYLAAEGELSTPEDVNPYLLSVMAPDKMGGVPLPDLNSTPYVLKSFQSEIVQTWQAANSTLLIVYTPASPTTLMKLFVQTAVGGPWAYLSQVPLSQPLNLNYQKARLVSAGMKVRSAAQAAGVFTLAGEITSVYVNTLPPFSQLTYNSLLSWAPNNGCAAKGIPIQKGCVSNWVPNGFNEYWNPESSWSYQFKELWDYDFTGANSGWSSGSPFTIAVGASKILFDSATCTNSPFVFGSIPDPFWGDFGFRLAGNYTATTAVKFSIQARYIAADPVTWAPVTTTVELDQLYFSYPGSNKAISTCFSSGVHSVPGNITNIFVVAYNEDPAAALTLTQVGQKPPVLTLVSYDYYRPNVMSPAILTMVTMVNAGQPVHLSSTYNYQLVPNPNLARNISVTTGVPDDILFDSAMVVLSKLGKGVQMIWDAEDYEAAFSRMVLHEISAGRTAYEAAGPSLRSRLYSLWKSVNPYLSEMALAGAKGAGRVGLAALTMKAPMLAPLTSYVSDEYLAAPPCEDQEDGSNLYLAADVDYYTNKNDERLVVARPKPRAIVVASDFTNIVNGKSEPLANPRVAHFPVVPGVDNYTGSPEIMRIVISAEPLPGRNYARQGVHIPGTGAVLSYTAFFYSRAYESSLLALCSYGVRCGVIPEGTEVYVSVDTDKKVRGPSWEFAGLVALLGIAGPCVYSGGVNYDDPYAPRLTPVGALGEKAKLCQNNGTYLVAPASMQPSDISAVTTVGEIGYPGYLCSGLPLPPKMVMMAVQSPFDIVLFNLRIMKHRVNMNPDDQLMTGSVKVKEKKQKPEDAGLEREKEEARDYIERVYDDLKVEMERNNLRGTEIYNSLETKRKGWLHTIALSGTVEAVKLQKANIGVAKEKMVRSITAAVRSGQGTVGKKKAAKKASSHAHKQNLLQMLSYQNLGAGEFESDDDDSRGEKFVSGFSL